MIEMSGKIITFPKKMTFGQCVEVVKFGLEKENITTEEKINAIRTVAGMETYNSIKKDEIVGALKWIFEHYDFERM